MLRGVSVGLVLLAIVAVYQWRTITGLRAELTDARAQIDVRANALAVEKLGNRRDELTRAGLWLHEFYRSEEGLKRPDGLWIDGHPDFEGISAWLLDVYLRERISGASDEAARKVVVEAIRQSAEWKAKHPQGASNSARVPQVTGRAPAPAPRIIEIAAAIDAPLLRPSL